jgi:membrane-bound ClpP family serine protease
VLFVLEAQAPVVSYFGITGAIALFLGGFFLVGRFSNGDLPGGI